MGSNPTASAIFIKGELITSEREIFKPGTILKLIHKPDDICLIHSKNIKPRYKGCIPVSTFDLTKGTITFYAELEDFSLWEIVKTPTELANIKEKIKYIISVHISKSMKKYDNILDII